MTVAHRIESLLARFPLAAVVLYLAVIALLVFMALDGVLQVLQRRDAVAAAAGVLDLIENRGPARPRMAASDVSVPAGSRFLEGATASSAGAALLQRVAVATKRTRGSILSSQVDLQGPMAKSGFITATSSFEIEPTSLQLLLYDLEAGMPFMFVDQLVVQAPGSADGKLRVLLGVSAQWQGAK
jgi:general secretion pathway protein M